MQLENYRQQLKEKDIGKCFEYKNQLVIWIRYETSRTKQKNEASQYLHDFILLNDMKITKANII